jgi:hypothetical protein
MVRLTERRQAIAIHGQINEPWVRDKGIDPVPDPSGRKGNIATKAESTGRQAQHIETSRGYCLTSSAVGQVTAPG